MIDHRIPGSGDRNRPWPLSDEDRRVGDLAFQLMGSWNYWVKRRIEHVSLVGATTARHRLSVDFRIRDWFPPATVYFGNEQYYYLPLTLVSKFPLHNLDATDETGRALPVLTRRKRAAVSAAALSAMARSTVIAYHKERVAFGLQSAIPSTNIRELRVPQTLEDYFYRLANAGAQDDEINGDLGGPTLLDQFLDGFTEISPDAPQPDPDSWPWQQSREGGLWTSGVGDVTWRIFLADQPRFWSLLNDLAYMFPVFVPIKAEDNARRIVKLSYETQVVIPRLRSSVLITQLVPQRVTDFYAATKDTFEGILPHAGSDWKTKGFHTHPSGRSETFGFRLVEKASQALGWAPKTMHFAALSVGHGGSYHFEYEVPRGLQIRQATLTVHEPRPVGSTEHNGGVVRRKSVMGAQTLQRAHLYATDLPQNSAGVAAIRMKVAPTMLVRGAWFAALLSTALLFVGFVKIDTLTSPAGGNLGPSLALFLLLPGLIAGLLTRGDEHPMTTNMLFGLRCLCALVASLPTSAAFLTLGFRSSRWFVDIWKFLLSSSVWAFMVLSVTWWLAARRRPDGSAP